MCIELSCHGLSVDCPFFAEGAQGFCFSCGSATSHVQVLAYGTCPSRPLPAPAREFRLTTPPRLSIQGAAHPNASKHAQQVGDSTHRRDIASATQKKREFFLGFILHTNMWGSRFSTLAEQNGQTLSPREPGDRTARAPAAPAAPRYGSALLPTPMCEEWALQGKELFGSERHTHTRATLAVGAVEKTRAESPQLVRYTTARPRATVQRVRQRQRRGRNKTLTHADCPPLQA